VDCRIQIAILYWWNTIADPLSSKNIILCQILPSYWSKSLSLIISKESFQVGSRDNKNDPAIRSYHSPTLPILDSNTYLKNDRPSKNALSSALPTMSRLSHLRYKLFAHKLTSPTSDNDKKLVNNVHWWLLTHVDDLLTRSRLGFDTQVNKVGWERIDQRRSAQSGSITYRRWIIAPPSVIIICDICSNRSYHNTHLGQISSIISHTVAWCKQLGIECTIIYYDGNLAQEYIIEWWDSSIDFLNQQLYRATKSKTSSHLWDLLQHYHHQYYDSHVIILSDRYERDATRDAGQTNNILHTQQGIWYIRDYRSLIIERSTIPEWLIWLK